MACIVTFHCFKQRINPRSSCKQNLHTFFLDNKSTMSCNTKLCFIFNMQNYKLYPVGVLREYMPCSNTNRKWLHSKPEENNISVHVRGNIIPRLAFLISHVKWLPQELKAEIGGTSYCIVAILVWTSSATRKRVFPRDLCFPRWPISQLYFEPPPLWHNNDIGTSQGFYPCYLFPAICVTVCDTVPYLL